MNKTDIQLKKDIELELHWDPKVNSAHIGVSVDKGVVALFGAVDSFAEKWAAEEATKRVFGVRTIAADMTVKMQGDHVQSDADIALATQSALAWNVFVPRGVTAKVEQATVTLSGNVTWNYQRDAAFNAVRFLRGVVAVYNTITLPPQPSATQVRENVEAALQRQAVSDASTIRVDTTGGKVTLSGHASSWQSMVDAREAAWAVAGVTEVVDQMTLLQ